MNTRDNNLEPFTLAELIQWIEGLPTSAKYFLAFLAWIIFGGSFNSII